MKYKNDQELLDYIIELTESGASDEEIQEVVDFGFKRYLQDVEANLNNIYKDDRKFKESYRWWKLPLHIHLGGVVWMLIGLYTLRELFV